MPEGDGPFPAVVMFHGSAGHKGVMEPIAAPLAGRGFVVLSADWLVRERPLDAAAARRSLEAAGCALRFAAARGPDFGGGTGPLTVVGLSAGGLAGALVSLAGNEFGRSCEADPGPSPGVRLLVGIEGSYIGATEGRGGFAAAAREEPELARRLDPRTYLDRARDLRVVLFLGDEFTPAVAPTEMFLEALRGAGVPAELRRVSGPHRASTFAEGVVGLLLEERR